MALTEIKTSGIADDAVTTDKLANAINTERTANTAKVSTTINNNADNRVITGSGTANTLNGESNVVIDSSGNVGIGTTSPSTPLHIKNPSSTACRLVLENTGSGSDDSTQIWSQNNDLALNTNDSERMRIDSSGNVGIGKTPARKLDIDTSHYVVTSSGQSTTGIHLDGTHGNAGEYGGGISFGCGGDGSAAIAARQASASQHRVGLSFFTHDTTTSTDNAVEKVRLHDSGEVSFNNGICLGNSLTLAAANTLDDYEEGTFTPALGGDGNHGTYHVDGSGWYTKVGRKVDIQMAFNNLDLNNSASGTVMITGLPFTSSSGMQPIASTDLYCYNIDFNTSRIQSFYLASSETRIYGIESVADSAWVSWPVTDFNSGSMYLRLHLVYYV